MTNSVDETNAYTPPDTSIARADDEPPVRAVIYTEETALSRAGARGGLSGWQQKRVADFIEEHLAETVRLIALAELINLSPYHFARAFKQSFGVPPHRYHVTRRIARAKVLLDQPQSTVTTVALRVGFAETSSFSAAFRKVTGCAPTDYRRGLC